MGIKKLPQKTYCIMILAILCIWASNPAFGQKYTYHSSLYDAVLSRDGRLLSLKVGGIETIWPQPEWLGEKVVRQVGAGKYQGSAGPRSIAWNFTSRTLSVRIHDASQQGAARYHLPLSEAMAYAVFPREGGETYTLPADKHLNHTGGARLIAENGAGFDTAGRTTLPPAHETGGEATMFFYYNEKGFTNSDAITIRPFLKAPAADLLAFDFSSFPKDFNYTGWQNLDFPVAVKNHATQEVKATVRVQLEKFMSGGQNGEIVQEKGQNASFAPQDTTPVPFILEKPEPGPYEFVILISLKGETVKEIRGSLMVEMENWTLPDREPKDFDAFWKKTLADMRKRPLEPKFMEVEDRRGVPEGYRLVTFNGLGNTRVRGFIAFPEMSPGEKLPARLSLPGGGYGTGPLDTSCFQRGFINLAISAHDLPFGGESGRHHPRESWFEKPYQQFGAGSRETFYYRQIYANAVRAIDFLRSLPEVDATRIAVGGGSQGGAVALAVSGLAGDKIALTLIACPGRSRWDLLNGKWPGVGYFADSEIPEGHTRESLFTDVLAYFDTSYHAKRIRSPLYMETPMQDEIDPWPLQYWAWRQVPETLDKDIFFIPWARHNTTTPASREVGRFYMEKYILGKDQ